MPYNNAAIAPPEEITGQCSLPRMSSLLQTATWTDTISIEVARVKKILHIDEDTHQVSNNASFVITIATVSNDTALCAFAKIDRARKCSYVILQNKL